MRGTTAGLVREANLVRRDVVRMMWHGEGGHVGGALSVVDILTALYFSIARIDPYKPSWEDRDRVILSKGHAAAALYAVLARRGYFPRERLFDSFRIRVGGILQEHPDMTKTPGVDMSSGSLGQGLSVGVGMALGRRLRRKDFRIYAVLGDGELQEGQVWEAAMAADHYCLHEITAIVDCNRLQVSGFTDEVLSLRPLRAKWEAFNWHVEEIDGHDMGEILIALERAARCKDKPVVLIARTVKGKGVSFAENRLEWHSKAFSKAEMERAMGELDESHE